MASENTNFPENAWFKFTDQNGNEHYSRGDNWYIQESVNTGLPITVNKNGDWFIEPYLEQTPTGLNANIPSWFTKTDEYSEWKNTYLPQIETMAITQDNVDAAMKIMKGLGSQAALRMKTYNEADSMNIVDTAIKDKMFSDLMGIIQEGYYDSKASIDLSSLSGKDTKYTAADIARMYKNMSKEDLSEKLNNMYEAINDTSGKYTDAQKADAFTIYRLLNIVADDPDSFGEKDEFKDLLEASEWQKFRSFWANWEQGIEENFPFLTWGYRLGGGLSEAMLYSDKHDNDPFKAFMYGFAVENKRNEPFGSPNSLYNKYRGSNLRGVQGSEIAGTYSAAATTMVGKIVEGGMFGSFADGKLNSLPVGSTLSKVGFFSKKFAGGMIWDFYVHDLPIDFALYLTDLAGGKSMTEAWENPSNQQPLFGLFGPNAPAGLKYNMIGDAVLDLTMPVIGVLGNASWRKLNDITGGSLEKVREWTKIKNLAVQQKVSDMPVIGTGLKKLVNWTIGSENAALIREARKNAILTGSITPYTDMQNLLTLKNHYGAEVVAPMYKRITDELGINEQIKDFQKNANSYGGFGQVKAEWDTAAGGVGKRLSETITDDLPRQVKRGLLDYERLGELKGEVEAAGGLIKPKTSKEIAELEKRVAALPDNIKKFAQDFSELNKRVEQLVVALGLSTQDWVNALQENAKWSNYMTRQVLVPGGLSGAGKTDVDKNPIWSGKRTGFYNPDQTLSPTQSLDLKVHALGKAYAWNETARALVASEMVQGKVKAGGNAVDLSKKIAKKKAEIMAQESLSAALEYDAVLKGFSDRIADVSSVVKKINEDLSGLDAITVKSVFTDSSTGAPSQDIKKIISDFDAGTIKYSDDLITELGVSAEDMQAIVHNTYKTNETPNEVMDEAAASGINADASTYSTVSTGGVPMEYRVKDNEIVSVEVLDTDKAYSESISGISGGRFTMYEEDIRKIGHENAAAVNRSVMHYNENMPNLPTGSTVRYGGSRVCGSAWGCEPDVVLDWNWGWHIENGHVAADEYPVFLGAKYRKGHEADALSAKKFECTPNSKTGISEKPINTATLESTPIHEMGHSYMTQLAVLELNRKIDAGEIKIDGAMSRIGIGTLVRNERDLLEESFAINAMGNLGYDITGLKPGEKWPNKFLADLRAKAEHISGYAGEPLYNRRRQLRRYTKSGNEKVTELFSESPRMYSGNGTNSSDLCLAILDQMNMKASEFSGSLNPMATLKENGLKAPKGLIKDEQFNFPTSAKTGAKKAEWLDSWRQKNPYLKNEFTEETFQLANRWDSFLQSEIRRLDPNSKSTVPELLATKSGQFVEQYQKTMANNLMQNLKKLSGGEGVDSDLAMAIVGRNANDVAAAIDNYIIRQIDISAEELAKKMDGGLTADNLNTARITLWSDATTKESVTKMLETLVPEGHVNVTQKIEELFDTQAKGLAAYESLPIDSKALIEEKNKLVQQLYAENKKTMKAGEVMDKNSSFRDGSTHIIHYKEAGEDVYVAVDDPIIASILQKPYDFKEHGMVTESLESIANFVATTYRLGTTGINPISIVRNVLRDPIQAMVTGGFNPLNMSLDPTMFYRTLRQYGLDDNTIDDVMTRIRSWAESNTMTSNMKIGDKVSYRNRVEQMSNKLREATNSRIINALETPLESWEGFLRNQIGQQSFVKNFERTGDVDKALSAAMFDASNATTNFSHAIGKWKWATSTVPYLSSAVNGTISFWRLFNADPLGMTARITAGFVLPVMAITAWNLSSEENRKIYENLEEWYKQDHLVMVDPNGNVIAFPLPDEIKQFAGTARKLIEFTQDATPYSIPSIMAQGAFGFLPVDVDGYFAEDGSIDFYRGTMQMLSGLIPQAFTSIYEFTAKKDLFTGQDLSNMGWLDTAVNLGTNVFGTGFKQIVNSVGIMLGASESDIMGLSFQNTLARDLFGMGFNAARSQFRDIVGFKAKYDENGNKISDASGLFKENEELKAKVKSFDEKIAVAKDDDEKKEIEKKKQQAISDFTDRVKNLFNNYQNLFSLTGGLEDWQKNQIVQILTLGEAWSSADEESYISGDMNQAKLEERGLATQRYMDLGLDGGPTLKNVAGIGNSIEMQAALNKFYGSPKQATQDYKNAIEASGLKDIRNEFYEAMQKIYDYADENNIAPNYDMIEKIQARYLQAVDAVLIPLVQKYGITILNNNDFVDAVRRQVNGMIPSDDWRQSVRNAKKFLSTKDFPTASVDVKKWLKERYSSGMRNRNIDSDQEVTQKLSEIKKAIDAGNKGTAQGKIRELFDGINKANYYISAPDYATLTKYSNMVK